MLKQKYFLTGIFILSAERQPIKLAWRKIVWLPPQIAEICTVANSLPLFLKYSAKSLFFNRLNPTDENLK